jgi:uncharacterized membrane protein YgcG
VVACERDSLTATLPASQAEVAKLWGEVAMGDATIAARDCDAKAVAAALADQDAARKTVADRDATIATRDTAWDRLPADTSPALRARVGAMLCKEAGGRPTAARVSCVVGVIADEMGAGAGRSPVVTVGGVGGGGGGAGGGGAA